MANKETTHFVIFANARSGSTSLAKLLNESTDVNLCMEPFHPKYSKWNPDERNYSEFIKDLDTMNQALDEILDKYIAMKVLVYQFSKKIYLTMLARNDLKVVFLRRKNLAQAALSSLIGEQTSIWHKSDMDESKYDSLKPIKISEIEKIVDYVGEMNEVYANFLKGNRQGDYLNLFYEDLYSENKVENTKNITKICKFLHISVPPDDAIEKYMKPSRSKQNQNNIYSRVPNYEEIQESFQGSTLINWCVDVEKPPATVLLPLRIALFARSK